MAWHDPAFGSQLGGGVDSFRSPLLFFMIKLSAAIDELESRPFGVKGLTTEYGTTVWTYVRKESEWEKLNSSNTEYSVLSTYDMRFLANHLKDLYRSDVKGAYSLVYVHDKAKKSNGKKGRKIGEKFYDYDFRDYRYHNSDLDYNDRIIQLPEPAFVSAKEAMEYLKTYPEQKRALIYRPYLDPYYAPPTSSKDPEVPMCSYAINVWSEQVESGGTTFIHNRSDFLEALLGDDLHTYEAGEDMSIKALRNHSQRVPISYGFNVGSEPNRGKLYFSIRRNHQRKPSKKALKKGSKKCAQKKEKPKPRKYTSSDLRELSGHLLSILNNRVFISNLASIDSRVQCSGYLPLGQFYPYILVGTRKDDLMRLCTWLIVLLQRIEGAGFGWDSYRETDPDEKLMKLIHPFWEARELILGIAKKDRDEREAQNDFSASDHWKFYHMLSIARARVFRARSIKKARDIAHAEILTTSL